MKTRTLTLVLLAATLPTSLAAQTSSNTSLEVDQVKMRVLHGDTFTEASVVLRFGADDLTIHSSNKGRAEILKRLPYASIESADYSARGADVPSVNLVGRSPQRRLIIRCADGVTTLRLPKSHQKRICRKLARHSGVPVKKAPYTSRGSFHWPAAI
jgi:hypothetical protein